MNAEVFDADGALNRIIAAVTPFRERANAATTPEEIQDATQQGFMAGLAALGDTVTEERVMALLMAAVLRLVDVWNADAASITIPDSMPEAPSDQA